MIEADPSYDTCSCCCPPCITVFMVRCIKGWSCIWIRSYRWEFTGSFLWVRSFSAIQVKGVGLIVDTSFGIHLIRRFTRRLDSSFMVRTLTSSSINLSWLSGAACLAVYLFSFVSPLPATELMIAPFPSWFRILFPIMGNVYHLLKHLLVHGTSPLMVNAEDRTRRNSPPPTLRYSWRINWYSCLSF